MGGGPPAGPQHRLSGRSGRTLTATRLPPVRRRCQMDGRSSCAGLISTPSATLDQEKTVKKLLPANACGGIKMSKHQFRRVYGYASRSLHQGGLGVARGHDAIETASQVDKKLNIRINCGGPGSLLSPRPLPSRGMSYLFISITSPKRHAPKVCAK